MYYLNDDFEGGQTNFYAPEVGIHGKDKEVIASIKPKTGSILLFQQAVGEDAVEFTREHWPFHGGSPVVSGRPKCVICSDILFTVTREELTKDYTLCSLNIMTSQSLDFFFLNCSYEAHNFCRILQGIYGTLITRVDT
jgi:hypothetical protein